MTTPVAVAALTVVALSGCSAERVYNSGQAWRQNECNKVVDKAERDRSMAAADKPYGDYGREREAAP